MNHCLFCGTAIRSGRSGNKSEEHAFPLWLQKRIGAHGKDIFSTKADFIGGETKTSIHTMITFVAKRVCHGCNTGWMNDLEKAVQPLFEQMFNGTAAISDFGEKDQQTLRSWAYKTAIAIVEACPLKDKHVPEAHRRGMARDQSVPSNVHVVATHVGGDSNRFGFLVIGRVSRMRAIPGMLPDLDLGDSFIVVMHFATVAIAVLYCAAPIHVVGLDQSVHWPLGRSLNDYFWYCLVPEKEVQIVFQDDMQFWEHFARSLAVAADYPIGVESIVLQGLEYEIVGPPDPLRRRRPSPLN